MRKADQIFRFHRVREYKSFSSVSRATLITFCTATHILQLQIKFGKLVLWQVGKRGLPPLFCADEFN
jgi:hypothetical protein